MRRRIRWVAWAVFGMMWGPGLVPAAFPHEEGHTAETFAAYHSSRAELPVAFEYPAAWQVEESSGTHEAYAQVQVYGPASLEPRLRTYLVVRCVPPKAEGGRYANLDEMVESYRATLQAGLRVDEERKVQVLSQPATQLDVSGIFQLPLDAPGERSVPVKSQRIFFEQEGRLYELAWMGTPEVAEQVAAAFAHLLQALRVIPHS